MISSAVFLCLIAEVTFKGESDLSELTKATDLISGKFDDYERERQEEYKIIKELKSQVSDLNAFVKNLENQLDRQENYSRRNCKNLVFTLKLFKQFLSNGNSRNLSLAVRSYSQ